jgi:glycosyltransferase involved in cell wall biosynthesis
LAVAAAGAMDQITHGVDLPRDVAIPTHGEPRYLAGSIASVLAQTHAAFTLTVFDNGPGGGAAERIVRRFRDDPRIQYVATGGVPPAENWTRCIQAGEAPYVGTLHHDEYWDPEFLARRVAFLEAQPSCAYAFSAVRVLDAEGAVIARRHHRLREGVQCERCVRPLPLYSQRRGAAEVLASPAGRIARSARCRP